MATGLLCVCVCKRHPSIITSINLAHHFLEGQFARRLRAETHGGSMGKAWGSHRVDMGYYPQAPQIQVPRFPIRQLDGRRILRPSWPSHPMFIN